MYITYTHMYVYTYIYTLCDTILREEYAKIKKMWSLLIREDCVYTLKKTVILFTFPKQISHTFLNCDSLIVYIRICHPTLNLFLCTMKFVFRN